MLLTLIAEECNEVAQRASKAIRFGLNEVQEYQNLNNAQRLIYEFNDLVATMKILEEGGYFNESIFNEDLQSIKKQKIRKYLEYSKECGTLTE